MTDDSRTASFAVRFLEQLNDVDGTNRGVGQGQAIPHLQVTPVAAAHHGFRAGGYDVLDFVAEDPPRQSLLGQAERPSPVR